MVLTPLPSRSDLPHARGGVVGVRECRVPNGAPFRVFFPSSPQGAKGKRAASWFRVGVAHAAAGIVHTSAGPSRRHPSLVFSFVCAIARFAALFLPVSYRRLPRTFVDAVAAKPQAGGEQNSDHDTSCPLVVFSHGLTGTGEESALMFANWARQGFVVAALTHCDGSASRVVGADGKEVWYSHPNYAAYDRSFRLRQVQQRCQEVEAMRAFVLNDPAFHPDIRAIIDPERTVVAGFSFGGATAALCAHTNPQAYRACVLLDGWFRLDLADATRNGAKPPYSGDHDRFVHLPSDAVHAKGIDVPCLLLASASFSRMPTTWGGMQSVASKCVRPGQPRGGERGCDVVVVDDTTHMSFIELFEWFPWGVRWLKVSGGRPLDSYVEICDRVATFMHDHTKP